MNTTTICSCCGDRGVDTVRFWTAESVGFLCGSDGTGERVGFFRVQANKRTGLERRLATRPIAAGALSSTVQNCYWIWECTTAATGGQ